MSALQKRAQINWIRFNEPAVTKEQIECFVAKSQVSKVLFHVGKSDMEGFAKWAKSF